MMNVPSEAGSTFLRRRGALGPEINFRVFLSASQHTCQQVIWTSCLHSGKPSCLQTEMAYVILQLVIIAIANSKGGVGKSTLAVHLTAWLDQHGRRVILADCDTQQSSSEWASEAIRDVKSVRLHGADAILDGLPSLAHEADFIVADGPGSNSEVSRALLLRADLAIVPCKASMLEIRALARATDVLRQAQDIRAGLPDARIVLTMVREQHRLTQDMKEAAADLGLQLAGQQLTLRQIYADAPGQGAIVWNMTTHGAEARRKASAEVHRLFAELLPSVLKPRRNVVASKRRRRSPALV